MCDFGGIAPRDNSQHFFTAYVCSRLVITSTADRNVGFWRRNQLHGAFYSSTVRISIRFTYNTLSKGLLTWRSIMHFSNSQRLLRRVRALHRCIKPEWLLKGICKTPDHKEPERSGLNSCLSSPRRAQTISAWYIIAQKEGFVKYLLKFISGITVYPFMP